MLVFACRVSQFRVRVGAGVLGVLLALCVLRRRVGRVPRVGRVQRVGPGSRPEHGINFDSNHLQVSDVQSNWQTNCSACSTAPIQFGLP